MPGSRDAGLPGDVGKGPVVVVAIERVVAAVVGDVEVHVPIVVVILRYRALGESHAVDPGGVADLLEGSVTVVVEKLARSIFIADEEIEVPVVVDVRPGACLCTGRGYGQAGFPGDVGEGSIAVVAQQRLSLAGLPASAQHQNIHAAIVVIIGLHHIEAAHLLGQPRLLAVVAECAVAVVVEIMHGRAQVPA